MNPSSSTETAPNTGCTGAQNSSAPLTPSPAITILLHSGQPTAKATAPAAVTGPEPTVLAPPAHCDPPDPRARPSPAATAVSATAKAAKMYSQDRTGVIRLNIAVSMRSVGTAIAAALNTPAEPARAQFQCPARSGASADGMMLGTDILSTLVCQVAMRYSAPPRGEVGSCGVVAASPESECGGSAGTQPDPLGPGRLSAPRSPLGGHRSAATHTAGPVAAPARGDAAGPCGERPASRGLEGIDRSGRGAGRRHGTVGAR